MAHDPTYATVEEVSGALVLAGKDLPATRVSGAILRAEGLIDSVLQKTGRGSSPDFIFDLTKHGIIKDTVIALVGLDLITSDVEDFSSSMTAALTADMLWAKANRNMIILMSPSVSKYLKEV